MPRDVAAEIIAIRRALPNHVSMATQCGDGPNDGLTLAIDPTIRLRLEPQPAGWALLEVPAQGDARLVLASLRTREAPAALTERYTRLLLASRNAACGTPQPAPEP